MNLSDQVRHPALWPTPTATLGNKGGVVTPAKAREGCNLIEALALHLWPTPSDNDSGSRNTAYAQRDTSVCLAVRYPTPMTTDAGCPSPGRMRRHAPQLCCYADGGPLNPVWVEWLTHPTDSYLRAHLVALHWIREHTQERQP